jgi:hypothetical protein
MCAGDDVIENAASAEPRSTCRRPAPPPRARFSIQAGEGSRQWRQKVKVEGGGVAANGCRGAGGGAPAASPPRSTCQRRAPGAGPGTRVRSRALPAGSSTAGGGACCGGAPRRGRAQGDLEAVEEGEQRLDERQRVPLPRGAPGRHPRVQRPLNAAACCTSPRGAGRGARGAVGAGRGRGVLALSVSPRSRRTRWACTRTRGACSPSPSPPGPPPAAPPRPGGSPRRAPAGGTLRRQRRRLCYSGPATVSPGPLADAGQVVRARLSLNLQHVPQCPAARRILRGRAGRAAGAGARPPSGRGSPRAARSAPREPARPRAARAPARALPARAASTA